MCCAGFFSFDMFSFEAFSFAFVGAIWRGVIMYCKGSRYHVSLCAMMRGVPMHLCYLRDREEMFLICEKCEERCYGLQYSLMSTCIPQNTNSCFLTVNIVVDQPVRTSPASEINKEKGL